MASDLMAGSKVSVVLTVLNEGAGIRDVINGLLNQTRRPDEIVVCDGGSKDDTLMHLRQLAKEGAPLKVVVEQGACRGAGRNRAIEEAAYSIIALTDAGTYADPQWLEQLLLSFAADSSVEVAYGTVMPLSKNRFSRCLAALTIGASHIQGRFCPSAASLLMHKKIWKETGGFPEGLTTAEDLIFLDRLEANNARSIKVFDAVVHWSIPTSIAAVFRKLSAYSRGSLVAGLANRWHYGTLRNWCIYAFLIWLAIFIHPVLFLGLLFFHILRVYRYIGKIPWMRQRSFVSKCGDYIVASFILFIMDLATLNGLLYWVIKDHCRLRKAL